MFKPKLNPHELIRKRQLVEGLLWYAAYDEDVLLTHFKEELLKSNDFEEPQEERPLKI